MPADRVAHDDLRRLKEFSFALNGRAEFSRCDHENWICRIPAALYGTLSFHYTDPAPPRTPLPFNTAPISSRTAGSSMVAGMVQGSPSAIFFMVPRRILPDRVFGSRATTIASLNDASGPIF